jgi:hypothetical protein
MRSLSRRGFGALLTLGACCLALSCGGPAVPAPLVFSTSPSPVPQRNLLRSADFREEPLVWEAFRQPTAAPVRLALDQAGFVSLTLGEVKEPVAAGWRQAVRVEGGASYRVSVRTLAEGLAGYADLRLAFYDGDGRLLWTTGVAPMIGQGGWTACGARYRAPEGARYLLLSLGVERARAGRAAFAEPFLARDDAPAARALVVDYGQEAGELRPLLGASSGPEGPLGVAGTPLSVRRLFGAGLEGVFPHPWADPEDPASYTFDAADAALARLLEGSMEVSICLEGGDQWAGGIGSWVEIARHIAMHYSHAWAGGYRYGIRYWEVTGHGSGGARWCDVVEAAVPALKEHDMRLRVGCLLPGPGPDGEGLVACLAERGVRPDFVSWRLDCDGGPFALMSLEDSLEALLERHGFGDAEVHVYWTPPPGPTGDDGVYQAAHLAAAFAYAQESALARAWLTWAGPAADGALPERVTGVLRLLEGFKRPPRRLTAEGGDALGFALLAAGSEDGRLVRILIADTGSRSEEYRLGLAGFPPGFRYTVTEVSHLCAGGIVARGSDAELPGGMLRLPWRSPAVHLIEVAWDG